MLKNPTLIRDIILCVNILLLGVLFWKNIGSNDHERLSLSNVSDTTLSGMHYIIYTEPRTGDLVVVNSTIDSLRVQMYKSQIK